MEPLALHEVHDSFKANFGEVAGYEVVQNYGSVREEHAALTVAAGVMDLSFRGRLCLTGQDRIRFLHGQVTNDVKRLKPGTGCYAALITAKGKMESDLNIYGLENELLLDFEPGLMRRISERLEKYIIADDVQIVPVTEAYSLLSVQGPKAENVVAGLQLTAALPRSAFEFVKVADATIGEIYIMNQPRLRTTGFDLFVPSNSTGAVFDKLVAAAKETGGGACGWGAFEVARIESGIPRFGADMDETNIPLEAGIEERAVSFSKGCYIGQEVISRIKTYGQVAKALRFLEFAAADSSELPAKGRKLLRDGKEVGYVTSAVKSLRTEGKTYALGYVRKEANEIGSELAIEGITQARARIVNFPGGSGGTRH
jgi:folate-binding protein YgfZ